MRKRERERETEEGQRSYGESLLGHAENWTFSEEEFQVTGSRGET